MVYVRSILLVLLFVSCRKLISVSPPVNEQPASDVFSSDVQADAAVADLYFSLGTNTNSNLLSVINGMAADEGGSLLDNYAQYVSNSIMADDVQIDAIWRGQYQTIYRCNAVLEGLARQHGLTPEKVRRWRGEALFVRTFCHYYLLGCWGDVPFITTTDVSKTSLAFRMPVAQVYALLQEDLLTAMDLLPMTYTGSERVRANRYGAIALMARIALQSGDAVAAERYATMVIDAGAYRLCPNDSVFLYHSPQAILQIWNSEGVTVQGQTFIPRNNISYYPLTKDMMGSFEVGDQRRRIWTRPFNYGNDTLYYVYKYKNQTTPTGDNREYLMVLRLAEQYLIRAEARAQQQRFEDARVDLNIIRQHAGLHDLPPFTGLADCMQAVVRERRVELFTEWGDRWLTLKRTGMVHDVLRAYKPASWKDWAVLYPIPRQELNKDKNLTQNDGY